MPRVSEVVRQKGEAVLQRFLSSGAAEFLVVVADVVGYEVSVCRGTAYAAPSRVERIYSADELERRTRRYELR